MQNTNRIQYNMFPVMNFTIIPNKTFLMLGYKDTNNYCCVLYLYISFLYTLNKTKH